MDNDIKTTAEAAEANAMPRLHEVHCGPVVKAAKDISLPKGLADKPVEQKSPAQWAYERTIVYLKKFEEGLDENHEIAMGFAGTDAGVLRIAGMGFFDPDIVTFYGSDSAGGTMQLVQHVTQLNVVFRAIPKAVETSEPVRIGFKLAQDLESGTS